MQVTRREMLTAASAVGITSALAQGVPAGQPAEPDAEFAMAATWVWAEVIEDHYLQCIDLLKQADYSLYKDLFVENLKDWKAWKKDGIDVTHTAKEYRVIRGLYLTDTSSAANLRIVYAFEYREVDGMTRDRFKLFVIGSQFGGTHPRRRMERVLTKIQADLVADFIPEAQPDATLEIKPLRAFSRGSNLGMLIRYIRSGEHAKYRIEKDAAIPPTKWELKVSR